MKQFMEIILKSKANYFFFSDDAWEFDKEGFIEDSIKIL